MKCLIRIWNKKIRNLLMNRLMHLFVEKMKRMLEIMKKMWKVFILLKMILMIII